MKAVQPFFIALNANSHLHVILAGATDAHLQIQWCPHVELVAARPRLQPCHLVHALVVAVLPCVIRVDNEACFNSRLVKTTLTLLGIRLQTIDLHAPWQNGRIERFFGTFKRHLDRIAIVDKDELRTKLVEFRAWYNHARPHQHLHGKTPAEVWRGTTKSTRAPRFVSVWEGRITGWFFPP
ncbi:integrase core domain-containing protein [Frateuria defendens]|uniref:integrase core domain-containing protein n=1 Tax=Frateuria defendens TaxID=2219559 RepID=UPI0009E4D0E4|nr:integrase core domain-containing protein [Frateuria defendens]